MESAKEFLQKAQERQKKQYDKNRQDHKFQVGQKVLVKSTVWQSEVDKDRPAGKLIPKYIGLLRLEERTGPNTFRVQLPPNSRHHPIVNVDAMKPYSEGRELRRHRPPDVLLNPETGEQEYEVEEVLDKKLIRGRPHYLIKFKGYPVSDSSWLPMENLVNARRAVQEFERTHRSP